LEVEANGRRRIDEKRREIKEIIRDPDVGARS
jgi:hypothetical protein